MKEIEDMILEAGEFIVSALKIVAFILLLPIMMILLNAWYKYERKLRNDYKN